MLSLMHILTSKTVFFYKIEKCFFYYVANFWPVTANRRRQSQKQFIAYEVTKFCYGGIPDFEICIQGVPE